MHTYINAVLSAIYMYDMYVYIYRYIYKVASKNGFLICNACSHSHSPTLHVSTLLSIFQSFPFIKTLSFLLLFSLLNAFFEHKVPLMALSKVLRVDSLRYLQERLALQHLLPAVPSRCMIVRPENSGASSYPIIAMGCRAIDHLVVASTITDRRASGTPRCMNLLDFVYILCVLLTVLFGANRIRYRRGTLSPLTPRRQPHVVQGVRV